MPSPDASVPPAPGPAAGLPTHNLIDGAEFAHCQELFAAATGLGLVLLGDDLTHLLGPAVQGPQTEPWLQLLGNTRALTGRSVSGFTEREWIPVGPLEAVVAPIHVDEEVALLLVGGPVRAGAHLVIAGREEVAPSRLPPQPNRGWCV